MTELGISWSSDALNSYIAAPYQFLPGTTKIKIGIESEQDRAALIAYLASLTE
jgi:cytochrome c2